MTSDALVLMFGDISGVKHPFDDEKAYFLEVELAENLDW
jgi:hypothetical protein